MGSTRPAQPGEDVPLTPAGRDALRKALAGRTRDIFELAEVVRNLAIREMEKGLSTGEKQMFVKAKKILASELMYAKAVDEEEAAEWLEGVLAGNGEKPQKKSKAKAAAATA